MAVRIPDETIDKIRSDTNIVDVISQYVQLKKRGKNYFGFCPFHDERTPSFSVTDEKQIFHCFSCGRGGNIFSFLMEVEGISFIESVQKAAELTGNEIALPTIDAEQSQRNTHKDQLIAIHEAVSGFYHQVLMNTVLGEGPLQYLRERGFTDEILVDYQIGYSPPNKLATAQILEPQHYKSELLKESGIFVFREGQEELLDRFAGRIIVPLRDEKGRTIAFSGRIVPSDEPKQSDYHEAKYLNSPETTLFSKRNFLFNLDKARREMRKQSEVVLFEGYMDVISAHQAGIQNGVASMGTALTNEQVRVLSKLVDSVVLAYDGDRAGMEATNKALELLSENRSLELSVIPLPEGQDPDDFIQSKGKEAFQSLIKSHRESAYQFDARFLSTKLKMTSEKDRITYLETMIERLAHVDSMIERELYVNELAAEFDVESSVLKKQLQEHQRSLLAKQASKRKQVDKPREFAFSSTKTKRLTLVEVSERMLLYRLFHHEEAWSYLHQAQADFHFTDETNQTVFLLYEAFRNEWGEVGRIDSFLDRLQDQTLTNRVIEIEMIDLHSELFEEEIRDLVQVIRMQHVKDRIQQIPVLMKEAQREQDTERAKRLLEEQIVLLREVKKQK